MSKEQDDSDSSAHSLEEDTPKEEEDKSDKKFSLMNAYNDLTQFEKFGYMISAVPSTSDNKRPFEAIKESSGTFELTPQDSDAQAAPAIKSKKSKTHKKGSIISPEDREPPSEDELDFFQEQIPILHNLLTYNMQYLAFFPQDQWREIFDNAVQTQNDVISNEIYNQLGNTNAPEQAEGNNKLDYDHSQMFDEFLLEPANENEPMISLTFAPEVQQPTLPVIEPKNRKRNSIRYLTRNTTNGTGFISSPGISVLELMSPKLPDSLRRELSDLTTFQKSLSRYKCREVLGFYKLMLRNKKASKLVSAQLMENSSRFVVRTILNWAREYFNNRGCFNKSKIGKHKRVSLFAEQTFQTALRNFAEEQGEAISVDSASQFIKRFHKAKKEEGIDLPGPPSSRATVHRWLKLLDIKLGPRGKKRTIKR